VDPLDPHRRARHDDPPARPRASSAEEKALAVLDLSLPITLVEVKARYKQLVKRHHPDANGGDKAAEERLKLINEAYATLRHSLAS
jgi:curved DNA-binding protein CbpA